MEARMELIRRSLRLLGIVKIDGMSDRVAVETLAANLQRGALAGHIHVHSRDRHRSASQPRIHPAGYDANAPAACPELIAGIQGVVAFGKHAIDLETFPPLETIVLLGAAESGLARRD